MKISYLKFVLAAFLMLAFQLSEGQSKKEKQIEFKNAPVLFKQNNISFQQVILTCRVDQSGTILVSEQGKEGFENSPKKRQKWFYDHPPCC